MWWRNKRNRKENNPIASELGFLRLWPLLWTAVFKSCHRFLIGFRSGLWLGHWKTWLCFDQNHLLCVLGHSPIKGEPTPCSFSALGFLPGLWCSFSAKIKTIVHPAGTASLSKEVISIPELATDLINDKADTGNWAAGAGKWEGDYLLTLALKLWLTCRGWSPSRLPCSSAGH